MNYIVKAITSEQTLAIRHQVMWPNKPLDYVRVPDDEKGRHFALMVEGKMVSVVSLFVVDGIAQFRKFATLVAHQGKGYGSILLKQIFAIAAEEKAIKIWCNARVDKCAFYTRFGMHKTEAVFTKGGVDYVIMEREIE